MLPKLKRVLEELGGRWSTAGAGEEDGDNTASRGEESLSKTKISE